MASKNYQKKKIQDMEDSGFGDYQEEVGGGASPSARNPSQRAPGVNSNYRKNNNDTMQPRTDDGKFTYKSVNGKSINPKYGPSRGKTVNPLLTGGENGVLIEDVEKDFANKSGTYWNKYKDKWYQKGSEVVTTGDFKTHVAAEAIWEIAKKRYNKVNGEFNGESKVFDETKKGRRTAEEKAAQQQAKATGEEQGVISSQTGGLKVKPGITLQPPVPSNNPTPKPTPAPRTNPTTPGVNPTPKTNPTNTGVNPTTPGNSSNNSGQSSSNVNTTNVNNIVNADYTPRYSDDDINQVISILKENGFTDDEISSFNSLSPKEKDDYIDKYFGEDDSSDNTSPSDNTNSSNSGSSNSQPSKEENKKEEDSEAIKKIKAMGFSD